MISFHLRKFVESEKYGYSHGWKVADTMDLERIAKCIVSFVWSPSVFNHGHRAERNFLGSNFLSLDFEDERYTLPDAQLDFCDFNHIIGTTRNHRKIKDGRVMDRFRVIIPVEETMRDLETYRYNIGLIIKKFPADRKCKDGARMFYPCSEIYQFRSDGFNASVSKPETKVSVTFDAYHRAGLLTPFVLRCFRRGAKPGFRNNTAFAVSMDLAKSRYTQQQAFDLVVKHIYNGQIDASLESEISKTIASAYKTVERQKLTTSHKD